jgi:Plasmid pRiA4b ORF-3-like protein
MPGNSIYQLKLTVTGSKPSIWRRIQLPENTPLVKVHKILQIAMAWEDYHLHQFQQGKTIYAIPSPDDVDFGFGPKPINERKVDLNSLVSAVKDHFVYNYDFGDDWELKLVLESIIEPEEKTFYPRCIAGARNAPPEDSGGIWGYHEYCQAIRDPQHPQHEELLQWRGPFDPEHFSLDEINQELRHAFTPRKSRPKKAKA